MARKVFKSILSVAMLVLLITTFFIVNEMYRSFTNSQLEVLHGEAKVIAYGINKDGLQFIDQLDDSDYRITIINETGDVIYDNIDNDINTMDNHLDREEVIQAFSEGYGSSIRQSSTLMERYIYTAILLSDGNVVRLASTYPSVYHFLTLIAQPFLVIILLIILVSLYIAYKLANRIVKPLNDIDTDMPDQVPYNEIRPIMEKLSAQKKMIEHDRETLRRRRQEFETITANINEGLLLLNDEMTVIEINKSAQSILETDEDLIGRNISEIGYYEKLSSLFEDALLGHRSSKKIKIGDRRFDVEVSPVEMDKEVIGIVLFLFDDSFKEANEVIRKEFASNVSHELKTPLQTISGYSELLKNGFVREEDQEEFADKIYLESQRMMKLIEDVIKLSHLDNDELQIRKERIDLDELCRNAVETIRKDQIKDIDIIYQGKEAMVYGNRELIESIIFNLCENAVRYNVKNGKVYVTVSCREDSSVLEVKDTGIGIDRKDHERIFERFYRVDKGRSKNTGGTGLGLSIVKHACILNDARIELESKPGKGSTFRVFFPKA
jgi:two-component system phosphate regulon sensor histidine kinase PhoR